MDQISVTGEREGGASGRGIFIFVTYFGHYLGQNVGNNFIFILIVVLDVILVLIHTGVHGSYRPEIA